MRSIAEAIACVERCSREGTRGPCLCQQVVLGIFGFAEVRVIAGVRVLR